MDHVLNLERDSEDNADPYTTQELEIIQAAETSRISEKNAFLFACFTGLRISEWMALGWEDIDLTNGTMKVRRAVVQNDYKVPKTKGSVRTVHLLDQAVEILQQQKEISFMHKPVTLNVLQMNNRTRKKEKVTFIFTDTFNGERYYNSYVYSYRFFENFMKKVGLRYRGANQGRHTYASRLLTHGIAERWIMREMGHASIATFERHYGRWMDDEMPGMAQKVSKILQFPPPVPQENLKIS